MFMMKNGTAKNIFAYCACLLNKTLPFIVRAAEHNKLWNYNKLPTPYFVLSTLKVCSPSVMFWQANRHCLRALFGANLVLRSLNDVIIFYLRPREISPLLRRSTTVANPRSVLRYWLQSCFLRLLFCFLTNNFQKQTKHVTIQCTLFSHTGFPYKGRRGRLANVRSLSGKFVCDKRSRLRAETSVWKRR